MTDRDPHSLKPETNLFDPWTFRAGLFQSTRDWSPNELAYVKQVWSALEAASRRSVSGTSELNPPQDRRNYDAIIQAGRSSSNEWQLRGVFPAVRSWLVPLLFGVGSFFLLPNPVTPIVAVIVLAVWMFGSWTARRLHRERGIEAEIILGVGQAVGLASAMLRFDTAVRPSIERAVTENRHLLAFGDETWRFIGAQVSCAQGPASRAQLECLRVGLDRVRRLRTSLDHGASYLRGVNVEDDRYARAVRSGVYMAVASTRSLIEQRTYDHLPGSEGRFLANSLLDTVKAIVAPSTEMPDWGQSVRKPFVENGDRRLARAGAPPAVPDGLTPREAEFYVRDWMVWLGDSDARVTQASNDGGVAVVSPRHAVQVKHYEGSVGVAAFRELVGTAHLSSKRPVMFTSGHVPPGALKVADATNMPVFVYNEYAGSLRPLNSPARDVLAKGW